MAMKYSTSRAVDSTPVVESGFRTPDSWLLTPDSSAKGSFQTCNAGRAGAQPYRAANADISASKLINDKYKRNIPVEATIAAVEAKMASY
jgi:hypothetical protein